MGSEMCIRDSAGPEWATDMDVLRNLENHIDDKHLLEKIDATKLIGKHKLSQYIQNTLGISVDPSSMFDVQVKRIHEYKRQHLLALWIVSRYLYIKNHKDDYVVPRTVIFGGKAAPGYYMAKEIIRFICNLSLIHISEPTRPY